MEVLLLLLLPVGAEVYVDQRNARAEGEKGDLTTFIELMGSCMTPTPPSFLVGRVVHGFCE